MEKIEGQVEKVNRNACLVVYLGFMKKKEIENMQEEQIFFIYFFKKNIKKDS